MAKRLKCNKSNCFQNKCGVRCELLTEPTSQQPCPFFKTEEEVEAGRVWAHRKLAREGKWDLIKKYEYNPYRRGQW